MGNDDIATADDQYESAPLPTPVLRVRAPIAAADPYALPAAPKTRFGIKSSAATGLRANIGLKQGA